MSVSTHKIGELVVFQSVLDRKTKSARRFPHMFYTDDEIRGLFRGALDQANQVHVLAELNACGDDEMREYLIHIGCIRSGDIVGGSRAPNIVHHDHTPGYSRENYLRNRGRSSSKET